VTPSEERDAELEAEIDAATERALDRLGITRDEEDELAAWVDWLVRSHAFIVRDEIADWVERSLAEPEPFDGRVVADAAAALVAAGEVDPAAVPALGLEGSIELVAASAPGLSERGRHQLAGVLAERFELEPGQADALRWAFEHLSRECVERPELARAEFRRGRFTPRRRAPWRDLG
jgi:hypothetical protein